MKYVKFILSLPFLVIYLIGNFLNLIGNGINKLAENCHFVCEFINHEITHLIDKKKKQKIERVLVELEQFMELNHHVSFELGSTEKYQTIRRLIKGI